MRSQRNYDAIVVGGGLVGSAIAYGLSRQDLSVALLDEGDIAFRASRGNFGLVWVQGKGDGMPQYALWTRRSADLWQDFAEELNGVLGQDIGYRKPGGLAFCMSEQEFEDKQAMLERMQQTVPGGYDYQMIGRNRLKEMLPDIGDKVVGASYCPHDGHVNPLYLLRALHKAIQGRVDYRPNTSISRIERREGVFLAKTAEGPVRAPKIILAAGLGNRALAPQVGLEVPVSPLRGQILITERLKRFLDMPTIYVRQVEEGGVMMGDSHEDVGFDTSTTVDISRSIAKRAIGYFPKLADANLVRTWGALRVMTPDGHPIYDQSESHPGAYVATCHSGVTLAAVHARDLAAAIARDSLPEEVGKFTAERFNV